MIAISVQTYMSTNTSVIQTPKLRAFQATRKTLGEVQGNDSTLLAIFVDILDFCGNSDDICHIYGIIWHMACSA